MVSLINYNSFRGEEARARERKERGGGHGDNDATLEDKAAVVAQVVAVAAAVRYTSNLIRATDLHHHGSAPRAASAPSHATRHPCLPLHAARHYGRRRGQLTVKTAAVHLFIRTGHGPAQVKACPRGQVT